MKIKYFKIISSLFILPLVFTACLGDSKTVVEYDPNVIIREFQLDTIYGKNYKFSIDQINGMIFNKDSMPLHADTIIDKILIKKLSSTSGLVSAKNKEGKDTIIQLTDSIDFSTSMKTPVKITSWSAGGINKKDYFIKVLVHQQDPDSLNWGEKAIASLPESTIQKPLLLNDKVYIFTENKSVVYTSSISDGHVWNEEQLTNFPNNANIQSITNYKERLYVATENGELYKSNQEGIVWEKDEQLSEHFISNLLAPFNKETNGLSAVVKVDDHYLFAITNEEATAWNINEGNVVPSDFPKSAISYTRYITEPNIENIVVVGNTSEGLPNDTCTVPWASQDGEQWYPIKTDGVNKMYCPKTENPSIFYYAENFYVIGKDFETFYKSKTLLEWKAEEEKFVLPHGLSNKDKEESDKIDYSICVDTNNFIWMTTTHPINEVWKGRLNHLGFKK